MNETCLQEYNDWVALLKQAQAEDLLKDPLAVWEEAWHVARTTYKPTSA